jgi:D-beta-D-heptose 7-phosphate kinase/D-beta-D-heptose 1-phosphate adenosyltransferase
MIKILLIGETCVDKFIYCNINRLSPEAPVPVLTPSHEVNNPGMVGNTAVNIIALIPDANIMKFIQEGNITKTRYVEEKSNHMFLRVDEGEDQIKPFEWSLSADVMLGQADVVIVSDYNKGFLSNLDLKEIGRKSKLSILDSKRKLTNDIVENFSFVKLNEQERNNNPELKGDNIITTLGKQGASYQDIIFPSPSPKDTIDVSGAGDTFTASFIAKYYQTKNISLSIKFANKMSSEVVSKRGVSTPTSKL